jgi:hypothetical protein
MGLLQGTPSGAHIAPPQMPALHWLLQHCPGTLQGVPSIWHMVGPQMPMGLQGPLQHLTVGSQIDPLGRHIAGWQTPPRHAAPGQQLGPLGVHGPPTGWQGPPPQVPLMQGALQQGGVPGPQAAPVGSHRFGWQTPPLHTSPGQHIGPPGKHMAPGGRHGPPPQVLLMQGALQHGGAPGPQNAPRGSHIGWPQMPPLQVMLQQSLGDMQALPLGLHAHGMPQMLCTSATHTLSQLVLQQ